MPEGAWAQTPGRAMKCNEIAAPGSNNTIKLLQLVLFNNAPINHGAKCRMLKQSIFKEKA